MLTVCVDWIECFIESVKTRCCDLQGTLCDLGEELISGTSCNTEEASSNRRRDREMYVLSASP